MWLFTNTGFVSAVSNGKDLMVRARDRADLGEESLPALADYYNIKISDEVHDISKHYKTTYTTYTTTWSW
jgi:hypothetical protein